MAHKFFLNDLKYTQTVSSFNTEHIYENYYNWVSGAFIKIIIPNYNSR